jgi:hypothetical protein
MDFQAGLEQKVRRDGHPVERETFSYDRLHSKHNLHKRFLLHSNVCQQNYQPIRLNNNCREQIEGMIIRGSNLKSN